MSAWTKADLEALVPHARAIFHGASYDSRLRQIAMPGRSKQAVRVQLVKMVGCLVAGAGESSSVARTASKHTRKIMERR